MSRALFSYVSYHSVLTNGADLHHVCIRHRARQRRSRRVRVPRVPDGHASVGIGGVLRRAPAGLLSRIHGRDRVFARHFRSGRSAPECAGPHGQPEGVDRARGARRGEIAQGQQGGATGGGLHPSRSGPAVATVGGRENPSGRADRAVRARSGADRRHRGEARPAHETRALGDR